MGGILRRPNDARAVEHRTNRADLTTSRREKGIDEIDREVVSDDTTAE